jgi:hypothetical protein
MPAPPERDEMIRDTRAAIAEVEKTLASDPRSASLRLSRDSLTKRLHALETPAVEGDRPLSRVGAGSS